MNRAKINLDIENWVVSGSAAYKIATARSGATGKQILEILELEEKQEKYREAGKDLTANQQKRLAELRAKRDKPDQLPEGAKTYLREEYNRIKYGIYKSTSSREMEKGTICEPMGLELIGDVLSVLTGEPVMLPKSEERKQNEYFMGEKDSHFRKILIENKCSWDKDTFDNADEDLGYYWQTQCYMDLFDFDEAILGYTLVDTPEHLIYDEFKKACWQKAIIDEESDEAKNLENQIRLNLTFEDRISIIDRVKFFKFERNDDDIEFLKSRVLMSREYLLELDRKDTENKIENFRKMWSLTD